MTTLRSYKGIAPEVAPTAYVDQTSVIVGQVSIAEDASIWPLVSARGDVNYITLGKRSNVQDGSVLHVTHKSSDNPEGFPLIIGDDVTVGHKVMLHGCTIKNRVLVGMSSIVLDGAVIEDDVMVGAGSLVPPNKVLQSGFLYVGSPVKQVRPLKEQEIAFLKQSAKNYVETKNEYIEDVKVIS